MLLASNWPDILEKDFRKIYYDQYKVIPAMIPDLFSIQRSEAAFEKTTIPEQPFVQRYIRLDAI